MTNNSGIHPQGPRVLIKPMEVEQKTASGIILSTDSQREREDMANTTGEVIEVGAEAFADKPTDWCVAGDKIVFAKYAGLVYIGKDGVKYRIINDDNVVATLDGDVKLVDPYLAKGQ